MMAPFTAPALDFEALLSREYRPARVTRLVPRELYFSEQQQLAEAKNKKKHVDNTDDEKRKQEEETARLVLSLVTQTQSFTRHLPSDHQQKEQDDSLLFKRKTYRLPEDYHKIKAEFHPVQLTDWESNIQWDVSPDDNRELLPKLDPMELLSRPRNPYLDNLSFDDAMFDGSNSSQLLYQALHAPLILELGVAGRSVARRIYQNTVLSAQRPTPASQSDAYQNRMDRDWSAEPVSNYDTLYNGISSGGTATGTLHADKDKMEALIEARQKKRAQMAKDKTNRVTEAMGTISIGGGRGRTITSSLMGPGGTERTGRPARHLTSMAAHEFEYLEQLDLVNSVCIKIWLVKSLS
jgi:hypothetical protein